LRLDNAVEPVHHQNRTKRGLRANDGEPKNVLSVHQVSIYSVVVTMLQLMSE